MITNTDARFGPHDTPCRDHRQNDKGQHVGHDVDHPDEHQNHAAGGGMGGHGHGGGDGT